MGGIQPHPAFAPDPGAIALGNSGQVLTMGVGGKPAFAAAGGGIPNATLYWVSATPTVSPNPFVIQFGDGKITGAMFSRRGTGQYVLDMTSLLSTGIYAIFPGGMNPNVAPGNPTSMSFNNAAFSGAWVFGSKNVGIAVYQWLNPWSAFDPSTFSMMILGQ